MRSDVYFGVDLESLKSDVDIETIKSDTEIDTVLSDVDDDYRVSPYRITEENDLRQIDDDNLRKIE